MSSLGFESGTSTLSGSAIWMWSKWRSQKNS